ncbi:MAG: sigma-54 dependent transcriptional regulator [Pseudomonadota bacterium]
MRLMLIGQLEGYISSAGKIALKRGAKVMHCEDIVQAMGALRNGKGADLIMMDVKMKIGTLVSQLNDERINIPVIACGIDNDTRAAVKAIQDGAKDYIPLPPDAELIAAMLEAVTDDQSTMIGSAPAMQAILKLADKIAPSEATILITGESGTGKEVMSRYIHLKSKRKDKGFIALNCAAIPEALLESELFGHEKGAFTGAIARRLGKFEEAAGGTLLLDEISEMHPLLQAKLLRAIQEREITRVGSNDAIKVDVRIIATSNRDLEKSVQKGEFREDLYFRLNVVNIPLPPLRDRRSDILPLATFFADKYADANGVPRKALSAEAQERIQAYPWRGNIRELENTMHRAILISVEDQIESPAIHLQDNSFTNAAGTGASGNATQAPTLVPTQATAVSDVKNSASVTTMIGRTIADVERDMILDTLGHTLGNRTQAATILGISIRTLRNKLQQYRTDGVSNIPAAMGE